MAKPEPLPHFCPPASEQWRMCTRIMAHTHVSKYQGQKPADTLRHQLPQRPAEWPLWSITNWQRLLDSVCWVEGKKKICSRPRGQEKTNEVRQKQTNASRLKAFIVALKVSNTTQSLFGRCLVYDRRRHSERIKRWNTDTLATGGLHLDISRWVRPLDLRCFPMERSQCLSEVPGLGLDQEVCLACWSHPGRNGILRLIVRMWFIKFSQFLSE